MGFLDILVDTLMRRKPGTSIQTLVKKLLRRYVKHWWKCATEDDLRDAKIYGTVRLGIALKQKHRMDLLISGLAFSSGNGAPLAVTKGPADFVWV